MEFVPRADKHAVSDACKYLDVQVHVPLYDPSTVMLLAVCSTQTKVHRARVLTRAVRSMLAQVCCLALRLLP